MKDSSLEERPPHPSVDRGVLFDGRLALAQPRTGYRFSLDALLVAGWVSFGPRDLILDAGCGVGVVGAVLAKIRGARRVVAVELQRELAGLAALNAASNGLADRLAVVHADVRRLPVDYNGAFDVVVANPPYRELGAGRVCPHASRAVARHELTLTFAELSAAAARYLKDDGRFFFIHQTRRLPAIRRTLGDEGLGLEALRYVRPFEDAPFHLFLAAARKGFRGGASEVAPLTIYAAPGVYTPEVAALYAGGFRDADGAR